MCAKSLDVDGDGGLAGVAEEGEAGNSGGDGAEHPAVHRDGLGHELEGNNRGEGLLDDDGDAMPPPASVYHGRASEPAVSLSRAMNGTRERDNSLRGGSRSRDNSR